MAWLDVIIASIITISVGFSLFRGFSREATAFLGWIATLWVTLSYHQTLASKLIPFISHSTTRFFLALVLLFIVTYSFSMMVNFIVKKYVFRTGLGRMDRVFATVFGVMRGCLFIVVLTILARFTSLPEKPAWRSSLLVSYFEQVAEQAWQILPEA